MNPNEILSSKNLRKAKNMLSGIKNNLTIKTYSKLLDISFDKLRNRAIESQKQVKEGTYRKRNQMILNETILGTTVDIAIVVGLITIAIALIFGKKPRPEVREFVQTFRKKIIRKASEIFKIEHDMTRETKEYLFFYGVTLLIYSVFKYLTSKNYDYHKKIKQILNSNEYGFTRNERIEILNNMKMLYIESSQRIQRERSKISENPDLENKAMLVENMITRNDILNLCEEFIKDLKDLGENLTSIANK